MIYGKDSFIFFYRKYTHAKMHDDIILAVKRIRHRFFWWNIIIFWFSNAFFSRSADHHIFFSSAFDGNHSTYFCICYRFLKSEWYDIYIFDSIGEFCYTILSVPINFSEWASILVRIIALPTRTRLIISLINPIPDYFLDNLNWPELKDT